MTFQGHSRSNLMVQLHSPYVDFGKNACGNLGLGTPYPYGDWQTQGMFEWKTGQRKTLPDHKFFCVTSQLWYSHLTYPNEYPISQRDGFIDRSRHLAQWCAYEHDERGLQFELNSEDAFQFFTNLSRVPSFCCRVLSIYCPSKPATVVYKLHRITFLHPYFISSCVLSKLRRFQPAFFFLTEDTHLFSSDGTCL